MKKKAAQLDSTPAPKRFAFLPQSCRSWGLLVFGAFALPMLAAIWGLSGFVVQDSPLYLYNSHIMLESFKSASPFQPYFALEWTPLPYWGAYAVLMALMPVLPARAADQVLMTLTSVGFATALMWLRWRVSGWQSMAIVAPVSIVLSINILWIYGLHSFLIGASLYLITLAFWWRVRERMAAKHSAILAALLVAGYFCHLVSMGLTVIGISVLAIATPGPDWRRRVKWTALSIVPLIPLMVMYRRMMQAGGEVGIKWTGITSIFSPGDWLAYLGKADITTIHNNGMDVPGGRFIQTLFNLPPPTHWALIGLLLLVIASVLARSDEDKAFYKAHRGWIALSIVLLVGGYFGPDDLGDGHGGFLRERVVLLGLATIVPILRVSIKQAVTRLGVLLLMIASFIQVCLLWDYGLGSNALVGEFMKAKPYVETGKRVAAVMVNPGWRYRASPVVHISNMLGIHTANLVWNNYGPALYYFPVKYRSEEAKKRSLLIGNDLQYYDFIRPEHKGAALEDYKAMMSQSHTEIDVLVVWLSTSEIDEINRLWFEPEPVYQNEGVKVLKHRAQ